jgi:hypothetical protein
MLYACNHLRLLLALAGGVQVWLAHKLGAVLQVHGRAPRRGEVTCTGSGGVVRGEPSLGIIDTDQDLSGDYKLDATISVKKGRAKAYVDTAGGGREGGEVSPGDPLRVEAVVALDEDDEDVSLNSKVLGKEVRGLRYEATALPQD